jgi:hypothetical protein
VIEKSYRYHPKLLSIQHRLEPDSPFVDDESRPTTFDYPGDKVALHWHDADAMSLTYPAAVPASSISHQPTTAHDHDGVPHSSKEQSDDKRFPLIGSLV